MTVTQAPSPDVCGTVNNAATAAKRSCIVQDEISTCSSWVVTACRAHIVLGCLRHCWDRTVRRPTWDIYTHTHDAYNTHTDLQITSTGGQKPTIALRLHGPRNKAFCKPATSPVDRYFHLLVKILINVAMLIWNSRIQLATRTRTLRSSCVVSASVFRRIIKWMIRSRHICS